MIAWPWMKGCAVSIADPTSPDDPNDDRPSAKLLIEKHRQLIDQVASELRADPLYDANKHDDVWIVRFLLSHKAKVKPSVKAAMFTLSFRNKHKLDEKDVRFSPPRQDTSYEPVQRMLKYCQDDTFTYVLPDLECGAVIGFVQFSGIDQHAVVNHVDESDWLSAFLYISEWTHQWLDYVTRTTGRLTKSVRIVDVADVSMAKINHDYARRFGKIMKVMEDCYPQLLQAIFICHAPSLVQVPWRVFRPLMPTRVVEKFDFIAPKQREKERKRLLKFISLEHLPVRFGGMNETWPVEFDPPSTVVR